MPQDKSLCFLCGTTIADTRDHVPPKMLSPLSPPSVFGFAPACRSCNVAFSPIEDVFRDAIAFPATHRGNVSANTAWAAAMRKLIRPRRSSIVTPGRTRAFQRLVDAITHGSIVHPSTNDFQYRYQLPDDIDYSAIVVKIARGLHYIKFHQRVPSHYRMIGQVFTTLPAELIETLGECTVVGNTGDFFQFAGVQASEDNRSGVWFMDFYGSVKAVAIFIRPDALELD